jgi:hypothetical protein
MKSETETTQRTAPSIFILELKSRGYLFESVAIFFIWPNVKIVNVKILVVAVRVKVDSGAEMPRRGYMLLANRPINITNAMLILTDRERYIAKLSVFK